MTTLHTTRPASAMAQTEQGDGPARVPVHADQVRRGTSVGRYTIVSPLGSGGMGVVYLAHDPELDRSVAIKLLSPGRGGTQATRQRASDLLREGRVAAQLAHPNVVRVYDVGNFGSELFIAMEYLQGQTLASWLETTKRERLEILDTFVAAGRGLAAAHGAHLVHGDFKPRNVMVTDDGRVVVLDFGLGRPSDTESDKTDLDVRDSSEIAGTPAYMAPELFFGEPTTEASDQFAFCVSLYAALVGKEPFGDAGDHQRFIGTPTVPPRRAMPAAVWRALQRGLDSRPEFRFATMDALLARIAPRTTRSPGLWLVSLSGLAAIGAYSMHTADVPQCDVAQTKLDATWRGGPRQALAQRYDGASWEFLAGRLDGFSDRWATQWTEVCTDRFVRMSQSSELFDRRMSCLGRGLAGVAAITESLDASDASVAQAIAALPSIVPPEDCSSTVVMLSPEPGPQDPAAREHLASLEADIARDKTMALLPNVRDEVLARASGLVAQATTLQSEPTAARAEYNRSSALLSAGNLDAAAASFRQTVHHAEAGGDDEFAAYVATFLVHVAGLQTQARDVELWADYCRAKLARLAPHADHLVVELATAEAVAARQAGDPEQSIAILEPALADLERTGRTGNALADLLNALGLAYREKRQHAQAIATIQRSLDLRREIYGADHPLVGESLYNLATSYLLADDPKTARVHLDQARTILEADADSTERMLAVATLLGPLLAEEGNLEQAATVLQSAVERARTHLPPQAFALNAPLVNLARIANLRGRHQEAIELAKEAIVVSETHRGTDFAPTAHDFAVLAEAYASSGQLQAALAPLERAVALSKVPETRTLLEVQLTKIREQAAAAQPR